MSILLQIPNVICPTTWWCVLGDHGYKIYLYMHKLSFLHRLNFTKQKNTA